MPEQNSMIRNDAQSWQSYTFVKVLISNTPPDVRAFDIWRNFRKYGNITRIEIYEGRTGDSIRKAGIIFKPPPEGLRLGLSNIPLGFICKNNAATQVFVRLDRDQPRHDSVKSPCRPNVTYNSETTLVADSIDFGVLRSQNRMTVMRSAKPATIRETGRPPKAEVKMILNLTRKELEVYFPTLLYSENAVEGKVREYRFAIALDDNFSICTAKEASGGVSYIVHVLNPPWYSRRLSSRPSIGFVDDARLWYEDDMWPRQTDVAHEKVHYALMNRTPIALRKSMNTINIARWTAFRFNFSANTAKDQSESHRVLEDAMRDFSLHIDRNNNFQVEVANLDYEASYWSLFASNKFATHSSRLSGGGDFELSFPLHYQLEVCISQGWLCEYDIGPTFIEKLKSDEKKSLRILTHVDSRGERVFDPMSIFDNVKYGKPIKARQLPSNCIHVHHATITATSVKLHPPTVEISNRVTRTYRKYGSHFLRVRFEDDEYKGKTKLYAAINKRMTLIFDRVRRALRYGIDIAGRHYEFLAWGNAQLREHGCYFFAAPSKELNAQIIRAELGRFDNEKIVAKRAARLGQCFSTTQAMPLRMPLVSLATCIPDLIRGKYNFSDGVGKISTIAAELVASNLKIQGPTPSCFQFRMGGCKGILVVDPALSGIDVKVRPSQFKFESNSRELEIIRCSQFWQPFLNRQLITVLSNLEVPDEVFLTMQQETIQALEDAMNDDNAAVKALRDNVDPNQMTLAVADLVTSGFRRRGEPFVKQVLNLWRAWSLKYLKEKAKIPISEGCFVLGCVDETGILMGHLDHAQLPQQTPRDAKEKTLPEVFVQYTNPQTGNRDIVEGVCVIARNPSLHPGDIRVVKAVNVPDLHHLCDVLVMPQTGDRDLPSMCSGGDLDGDDYIVIWDKGLIPPIWNVEPFNYDPPPPKTAAGEITTSEIIDFFCDYLQNDFLGRIAHAHLGAADYFDDGLNNTQCLELVALHSMAVDYPKSGIPAVLPRRLERSKWPHFMEKRGKPYHSNKVLGKLFDRVEKLDFKEKISPKFDSRILEMETPNKLKAEMEGIKDEYDLAMRRIMARYKIKTEFEVWSTFVLDHSRASNDFKFHEEIGQISRALKDQYRQAIVEVAGGDTFENLAPCAVAAYQITVAEFLLDAKNSEPNAERARPQATFISFPWLLPDILGKITSLASTEVKTEPYADVEKQEVEKRGVPSSDSEGRATNGIKAHLEQDTVKGLDTAASKAIGHLATTERKGTAPAKAPSGLNDPFIELNPFRGISFVKPTKKAPPKPKPMPKSTYIFEQLQGDKQGKDAITTKSGGGPGVSQPSPVDSTQASVRDNGFSHPSKAASVNPQAEAMVHEAESAIKPKSQFTSLMLGDGRMKDPAEMTAEEMAALGLGEDDDL